MISDSEPSPQYTGKAPIFDKDGERVGTTTFQTDKPPQSKIEAFLDTWTSGEAIKLLALRASIGASTFEAFDTLIMTNQSGTTKSLLAGAAMGILTGIYTLTDRSNTLPKIDGENIKNQDLSDQNLNSQNSAKEIEA